MKNYIKYEEKQNIVKSIVESNIAFDEDRKVAIDRGFKDVIGELLIAKHYMDEKDIEIADDIDIDTIEKYDKLKEKWEGKSLWKLNEDTEALEKMYEIERANIIKWYEKAPTDIEGIRKLIDEMTGKLKSENDMDLGTAMGEYLLKNSLNDIGAKNNILALNVGKRKGKHN